MSVRARAYLCAGLLAVAAGGYHLLRLTRWAGAGTAPTPLAVPLAELPHQLGKWRGTDVELPEDVVATAAADSYLRRDYAAPSGEGVALYVAYYGNVRDTVPHGPAVCYPTAGWVTKGDEAIGLSVEGLGTLQFRKLLYEKGSVEAAVLYWYCANGEQQAGTQWLRLDAARRRLFGLGGAYVIQVLLSTPVGTSSDDGFAALERFARASFPALVTHFPGGRAALSP